VKCLAVEALSTQQEVKHLAAGALILAEAEDRLSLEALALKQEEERSLRIEAETTSAKKEEGRRRASRS